MIEINLLPEELKVETVSRQANYFLKAILFILGILICAHIYLAALTIIKNSQLLILNRRWKMLEPQRKVLDDFKKEFVILTEEAKAIQQLTESRINWSERLNKLSLNLPSGIWFNEVSVTASDFSLLGSVVSLEKQEISLIDNLMDNLRNDAIFFKDFQTLELSSIQRKTIGGYEIIDFTLVGTLKTR